MGDSAPSPTKEIKKRVKEVKESRPQPSMPAAPRFEMDRNSTRNTERWFQGDTWKEIGNEGRDYYHKHAIAPWDLGGEAYAHASGSNEARKKASDAAYEMKQNQAAYMKKMRDRQRQFSSWEKATRIAREARKRQKMRAAAGEGRRDTILTSPLGVYGEPQSSKKTLLGA